MNEIQFVSESTVTLVEASASDEMVCHAAWVSNFGGDHQRKPSNSEYYVGWGEEARKLPGWGGGYAWTDEMIAWDKKISGLINFLYRERHMSPFEHGHFTFFIETPIFVTREFMRHRTASYNEMSSRYTILPGKFWIPEGDRPLVQTGKIGAYRFEPGTEEQVGQMLFHHAHAYSTAWNAYNDMLEQGIAREVARNVLPVGTMTQFYVTLNPRNLMQFLQLRDDPNALKEIRDVAGKIKEYFAEAMPYTFAAYEAHDWRNDKEELKNLRAEVQGLKAKLEWAGSKLPVDYGQVDV